MWTGTNSARRLVEFAGEREPGVAFLERAGDVASSKEHAHEHQAGLFFREPQAARVILIDRLFDLVERLVQLAEVEERRSMILTARRNGKLQLGAAGHGLGEEVARLRGLPDSRTSTPTSSSAHGTSISFPDRSQSARDRSASWRASVMFPLRSQ